MVIRDSEHTVLSLANRSTGHAFRGPCERSAEDRGFDTAVMKSVQMFAEVPQAGAIPASVRLSVSEGESL